MKTKFTKIKTSTLKTLMLTLVIILASSNGYSQVTMGSAKTPEKGAILDLKENDSDSDNKNSDKGLLFPRVKLISQTNLFPMFSSVSGSNYMPGNVSKTAADKSHMGLTVYNVSSQSPFEKGLYTWDGDKWARANSGKNNLNFFYMPSFLLETSGSFNTPKTFNLYDEYVKQFKATAASLNSSGAISAVDATPYQMNEIEFHVTSYDSNVLTIDAVETNGLLRYKVKSAPTAYTYITIVVVVK